MRSKKTIILTGGGTAGHVMPNLALVPQLQELAFDIVYIGAKGIEKKLALQHGLKFKTIQAGKLRRYFSWQNFTDIFRIATGFFQALFHLIQIKPLLVFSKGGFVSVPVALAAKTLRIPVITHESDLSPGLATKLISPLASKILYSFPDSQRYFAKDKALWVGSPVRKELFAGSAARGRKFCAFSQSLEMKKVLLVMGGSLGAQVINESLQLALSELVKRYDVIHLCGPGKLLTFSHPSYKAFEFVGSEMKDILALSDIVVTRGGANSLFELLALHKPMLIIPFVKGSRGDQVDNALCFQRNGWGLSLPEKDLNKDSLILAIDNLAKQASNLSTAQRKGFHKNSLDEIIALIQEQTEKIKMV